MLLATLTLLADVTDWRQWLVDHSPPPPPSHAPLHPDVRIPCIWSELGQVALHPYMNAGSVGVPGATPFDEPTSQAVCEERCEDEAACVAYTWKYSGTASRCWLLAAVGEGQAEGGAHKTAHGFVSAFCSRGARGTCCFGGAASCEACNRRLSPRSYCHSSAGACANCALRLEQQLLSELGRPAAFGATEGQHVRSAVWRGPQLATLASWSEGACFQPALPSPGGVAEP